MFFAFHLRTAFPWTKRPFYDMHNGKQNSYIDKTSTHEIFKSHPKKSGRQVDNDNHKPSGRMVNRSNPQPIHGGCDGMWTKEL